MTREEAIMAVKEVTGMSLPWNDRHYEALQMAIKALDEPERKKGKWTDNNACPFCGFQPWYERDIHTLSFCPNCGADLRKDGD